MATTTTNFGWDIPQSTDLVKDGATAIAALGQDIDTAMVDLKGGTTGQVLAKASGTDLDFSWVAQDDSNAIQNAIVDAKGDLIAATAADTPARLAVGTNGQILTADSTAASGLRWATPSGGGKVLQVVQGTLTTRTTITSTSATDTGLSASITPSATSSKVLVMMSIPVYVTRASGTYNSAGMKVVRGATVIAESDSCLQIEVNPAPSVISNTTWFNYSYLDSPSSTSSLTYKLQGYSGVSGQTTNWNQLGTTSTATIQLMEIGA
jgi:hypothetical protein